MRLLLQLVCHSAGLGGHGGEPGGQFVGSKPVPGSWREQKARQFPQLGPIRQYWGFGEWAQLENKTTGEIQMTFNKQIEK